jgi:hypothetical protein
MATAPVITYAQVGEVEDVSDIIGLISPFDTPCYSSFRKEDAHNTLVQWQEDSLRAPATNAKVEALDPTVIAPYDPTVMKSNNTQIFEESAQVSGTMLAVDLYGRANEMDYQVLKKGRELRRDIEFAFVGSQQTAVAGSSAVARQLASVQALIAAGTTAANGGTPRAFTEALVLAVHQLTYEAGGDPGVMMVPPAKAVEVANFAYASGRQRELENDFRTIVNVVDLYVSPFGEMSVVTNKWQNDEDVLLLEMDRWFVPTLRPISSTQLAKTGDTDKKLINAELSLGVENGLSSGRITDLS